MLRAFTLLLIKRSTKQVVYVVANNLFEGHTVQAWWNMHRITVYTIHVPPPYNQNNQMIPGCGVQGAVLLRAHVTGMARTSRSRNAIIEQGERPNEITNYGHT